MGMGAYGRGAYNDHAFGPFGSASPLSEALAGAAGPNSATSLDNGRF
jgi:hypothetical protein